MRGGIGERSGGTDSHERDAKRHILMAPCQTMSIDAHRSELLFTRANLFHPLGQTLLSSH